LASCFYVEFCDCADLSLIREIESSSLPLLGEFLASSKKSMKYFEDFYLLILRGSKLSAMIELDFSIKINGSYLTSFSSLSSYSITMPVISGDIIELLVVEMVFVF